ncbi:hypothetical protein K435DRAFT_871448 [Dendrothele bispora CBS 962.96]|uniref:Uncharacterized protein n=1 Tax=Dendrothele bispora (strain CBS 962.96) TaxID=1314807 RepID=A0A4S8L415_DENBC|nr:hypothetical protein K435DRAFT_871448 [Dendrothele bispora CBS 962.96]
MPPKKKGQKGPKPTNKVKARKTTGGSAPRKTLGFTPNSSGRESGTRKRKLDVALDSLSDNPDKDDALLNVGDDPMSSSDGENEVIDYDYFSKLSLDAQWCSSCNDNTETPKVTCDDCKHIVCYGGKSSGACLVLTPTAVKSPNWSSFICPACEHLKQRDSAGKGPSIYHGFYDESGKPLPKVLLEIRNRQFTWFKPLKLEPVAIVQLQVAEAGQDLEIPYRTAVLRASAYASGVVSVSQVLDYQLRSPEREGNLLSGPQPLLTSKINFDFATEAGMEQYAREMVNLRHAVNCMGISRVVFFVVTHSDPATGDLHFAPDGAGAQTLEVVMNTLFSTATEDWLRPKDTYLFNLVCGSKVITAEGYRHLQAYVTSRVFKNIFMFPTVHLQPHELTCFITNLLEHVLFHHEAVEPTIPIVLNELSGIGLHTRILHLCLHQDFRSQPTCHAVRHVWTHQMRRPWGLDAPSYCHLCKAIKSFHAERNPGPDGTFVVKFKCHGPHCRMVVEVPLTSAESNLVRGPKERHGKWQQHEFQWEQDLLERF